MQLLGLASNSWSSTCEDIFQSNEFTYGNPNDFLPYSFVEVNGSLYFIARDSWNKTTLVIMSSGKADGTEDGTMMVKDINSNGGNSCVSFFAF